jgi:hypothetical protein
MTTYRIASRLSKFSIRRRGFISTIKDWRGFDEENKTRQGLQDMQNKGYLQGRLWMAQGKISPEVAGCRRRPDR